jgi:hypothetical protein
MTADPVPKLRIENISKAFFKTVRDKAIVVPVLDNVGFSVDSRQLRLDHWPQWLRKIHIATHH